MEDIIKMYYPKDLGDVVIKPHIHKYTSPLNRVLVDYKLLMRETMQAIERKKQAAKPAETQSRMARGLSEKMQKSLDTKALKTNALLIDTEAN